MTKHRIIRVGLALAVILCLITTPLAQEQANSVLTVHVARQGENLFRIALLYDMFAEVVARANGIQFDSNIVVGQELIIPTFFDASEEPLAHTVLDGETIHSIATAYGKTVEELQTLNGLTDSGRIEVGQRLVIVPGAEVSAPAATPSLGDAQSAPLASERGDSEAVDPRSLIIGGPDFSFAHTVIPGDTVFDIGMRYGMTVDAVARANNLRNPSSISIGQRLVIPGIEPPRLLQALPEMVSEFTLDPLIFEEGRTGRIAIRSAVPVNVTGTFLDRELRVIQHEGGVYHSIMVGVPMFTEQGQYPLRISLVNDDGDTASISASLQVISGGYRYQTITIGNNELLDPAVEQEELDILTDATRRFTGEKRWEGSLVLPAKAAMNARFGTFRAYNGGAYDRYHQGVDFAGPTGTPVFAAADGMVVFADALRIRGNTVVIDHGWGLFTVYAHLHSFTVSPGDEVAAGHVIGAIGSTGRSTGPHLHWETWINAVNVDPLQWARETFP